MADLAEAFQPRLPDQRERKFVIEQKSVRSPQAPPESPLVF